MTVRPEAFPDAAVIGSNEAYNVRTQSTPEFWLLHQSALVPLPLPWLYIKGGHSETTKSSRSREARRSSHSVSLQLQLARNGLLCRDLQLAEVLAVMRRELCSSSLQEFRTGLEEMRPAAQLDVFACMLQLIAVVRP